MSKRYIILLCIVILLLPSIARAAVTDGIVGHYFETSMTGDESFNGNDLTCSGTTTNNTYYKTGNNSINFDSNSDYCTLPSTTDSTFDLGNNWTINCWYYRYPDSTGYLFHKPYIGHSSPYYQFEISQSSVGTSPSNMTFIIYQSGGGIRMKARSNEIYVGNWYMITGSAVNLGRANNNITIYVNATYQDSSILTTGDYANYATRLSLGNRMQAGTPTDYIPGVLHLCTVWNRLLDPSEIETLYNTGAGYSLYGGSSSYGNMNITNFIITPNASTTETDFYIGSINQLQNNYSFSDINLSIVQDWNGTLNYKGTLNITQPYTMARYTFDYDNSTDVIDLSMTNNSMNLKKASLDTVDSNMCYKGRCYLFEGGNNPSNNVTYNKSTSYTISFWMSTNTTLNGTLFSWGDKRYCEYIPFIRRVICTAHNDTDSPLYSGLISNDTKTNIIFQFNNTEQRMYTNGILNNASTVESVDMYGYNLSIGIKNDGSSGYLGYLDDLIIWNVSLTDIQVNNTYYDTIVTHNLANGTYISTIAVRNFYSTTSKTSSITTVFDGTYSALGIGIDNCSVYKNKTLTFNIYNENAPLITLNSSFEFYAIAWYNDSYNGPLYNKTINLSGDFSYTYNICLSKNKTVIADLYIKYKGLGGLTSRYYSFGTVLTSRERNITLYALNSTTLTSLLKITVRNSGSYAPLKNILGTLQRFYVGEGLWRSVQMDKSDDFGLLVYDVNERDTDYRIVFMNTSNIILTTTNQMRFSCTSGLCEFTIRINPSGTSETAEQFDINVNYNNDTGIVNTSFRSDGSTNANIRNVVIKQTPSGDVVICDTTINGIEGSITCDTAGITGTVYVITYVDGTTQYSEWLKLYQERLSHIVGKEESAFWAFGIILVVAGIGLASPLAGIISLVVGTYFVYYLGLLSPLTASIMAVIVSAGIGIGLLVRKHG